MRALEAAKFVDVVVWGRDLYTVPPGELRSIRAQMTMVNGKALYEAETITRRTHSLIPQ